MASKGDELESTIFFSRRRSTSRTRAIFIDEEQISEVEQQMEAHGGVTEGSAMASTFNMLHSNDLVLRGQQLPARPRARPFDLSTGTPMQRACRRRCTSSICAILICGTTSRKEWTWRRRKSRSTRSKVTILYLHRAARTTSRPIIPSTRRRGFSAAPVKFIIAGSMFSQAYQSALPRENSRTGPR